MKRLFSNKKIIIAVAAVLLVVVAVVAILLLRGRGDEWEKPEKKPEPIDAPIQYQLDGTMIPAIPVGTDVLVYEEEEPVSLKKAALAAEEMAAAETKPTKKDTEEEESSDTAEEDAPVTLAYRYEGWENAAEIISAYAALLTTEDLGYLYATETLKDMEEEPELSSAYAGVVRLIRRLPQAEDGGEKQAVAMQIQWSGEKCIVTMELVPASMTVRPKKVSGGYVPVLTFSGAVDAIRSMKPSTLGLDGDSMEDYRVYARDGLVMVDGQSCMRIDIYKLDKQLGTNIKAGNYFLSSDGLHLYLLNETDRSVKELLLSDD